LFTGVGDHPADGVAVHPRQVTVEHQHVVVVQVELEGGVHAVIGDVDGHALIAQAFGDIVGQPLDILGDQDPHRPDPARTGRAGN
jgi:hypothetical protein